MMKARSKLVTPLFRWFETTVWLDQKGKRAGITKLQWWLKSSDIVNCDEGVSVKRRRWEGRKGSYGFFESRGLPPCRVRLQGSHQIKSLASLPLRRGWSLLSAAKRSSAELNLWHSHSAGRPGHSKEQSKPMRIRQTIACECDGLERVATSHEQIQGQNADPRLQNGTFACCGISPATNC